MNESIEIEYKTLLSEHEYHKLIKEFHVQEKNYLVQANHYFDTPDLDLKKQKLGLRIRLLPTYAELTLKSPLKVGLLETTQKLSVEHALKIIENEYINEQGPVHTKLASFGIDLQKTMLIASLKTKRVEIPLSSQHLLVLDESWYHGNHDYELEMEVQEAKEGFSYFQDFLHEHSLIYNPPENKVLRAIKAKKGKAF